MTEKTFFERYMSLRARLAPFKLKGDAETRRTVGTILAFANRAQAVNDGAEIISRFGFTSGHSIEIYMDKAEAVEIDGVDYTLTESDSGNTAAVSIANKKMQTKNIKNTVIDTFTLFFFAFIIYTSLVVNYNYIIIIIRQTHVRYNIFDFIK